MALVQAGQAAAGVVELERCAELSRRNPGALASLAQGYVAAGRLDDARAIVSELADAVREERDNWPTWLALDPRFAALQGEPRFQRLIAEMGFERGRLCAR